MVSKKSATTSASYHSVSFFMTGGTSVLGSTKVKKESNISQQDNVDAKNLTLFLGIFLQRDGGLIPASPFIPAAPGDFTFKTQISGN